MALNVSQSVSGARNSGSTTISLSLTGVAVNDYLVCAFGGYAQQGGAETISTTAGTTSAWTQLVQTNSTNLADAVIWIAQAASTSITVQVTNWYGQASLLEIAGSVAGATDGTNSNVATSGTAPTVSIGPGSHVNDLVVVVAGSDSGNFTVGPTAPWTIVAPTGNGGLAAWQVLSGNPGASGSFTTGTSQNWAAVIVQFAGGPSGNFLPLMGI